MKKRSIIQILALCLLSTGAINSMARDRHCNDEQKDEVKKPWHSAGGPAAQLLWLDSKPLKDLARTDRYLKGKTFDFDDRMTPFLGLTSYHESHYGVRTGGGIWAGYKRYESTAMRIVDTAGVAHDSVTVMRVIPVYGGFSIEKGIRMSIVDFHAGILMGGGAYIINQNAIDNANPSVFEDNDAKEEETSRWGAAGFATAELNAGVLVALSPRFQVGADGVVNMIYSPEGFGPGYGDFVSVNPGVRVRLLWGR